MEAVGARLGRSSTRHGPTTAFTGPVRKWRKTWVAVKPSNIDERHHATAKRKDNDNSSRLSLYQWTPITPKQNKDDLTNNSGNNENPNFEDSNNDGTIATEEPPKRRFKYIPIAVLEEQMNESLEQAEDDSAPIETHAVEETSKADGYLEKLEIVHAPMDEENQAPETTAEEQQDLNQSTDSTTLRLDLQVQDGANEPDSRSD